MSIDKYSHYSAHRGEECKGQTCRLALTTSRRTYDGTREPFNDAKLRAGLLRALEKRPVSVDEIEEAIGRIQHGLRSRGEREVPSKELGELVMDTLRGLDPVAYVRFASVYRDFQDISEFQAEIENLARSSGGEPGAAAGAVATDDAGSR